MDRLGVTVQQIPGGEIYPALERGVIDAAEWVGPYDDEKLGFNNVADYYYYPGWWEPGANLSFLVNRVAWDGLPPHYQAALEAGMEAANMYMLSRYDAVNPPAMRRLAESGTQVRPFPEDVMAAAFTTSREIIQEGTSDPAYAKIHVAYHEWRDEGNRWLGLAQNAYASFVHNR